MKKHELKDYQKAIQNVLANSEDEQASPEHGQNRTEHLSTPRPSGSDYYSSGENRLSPPTAGLVNFSISRNVIQNQYKLCNYLSLTHQLWEQADHFLARGSCDGEHLLFMEIIRSILIFRVFHPSRPGVRAAEPALLAQGPRDLHQEEPGLHRAQPEPDLGRPDARDQRGLGDLQELLNPSFEN